MTGGSTHDQPAWLVVRELAMNQHGVIRLDQALAAGLSRHAVYRLARKGEWQRLLSGVFAVDGGTGGWKQRVMAACLWGGDKAAASHRTAGKLWELDGVPSGFVEIALPGSRCSTTDVRVHRVKTPFAIQRADGIPTTSATRTLLDLASVLAPARLELALEDALRKRLVSIPGLRMALRAAKGLRGTRTLGRFVESRASVQRPTDSEFEARLLQVLAKARLPRPLLQHVVELRSGTIARLDFAYPELMIGIEADGFRWHSGRAAWSRDRTRLNQLSAGGWHIFHVTYEDLACGAADLVSALRAQLGQQRLMDE